MAERIERALSVVLVAAAVVMTGAVLWRSSVIAHAIPPSFHSPEEFGGWQDVMKAGVFIGDSTAPVKIVELADFECPFCRTFAASFGEAKKRFGKDIALVFVHLPIGSHRFAIPTARAAECARVQGKFGEFYERAFTKQDSLGLKSWASFAHDAGVPDSMNFASCVSSQETVPQIVIGKAVAKQYGITATPTVIINGWRFYTPPNDTALITIIAAALDGDSSLKAHVRQMKP